MWFLKFLLILILKPHLVFAVNLVLIFFFVLRLHAKHRLISFLIERFCTALLLPPFYRLPLLSFFFLHPTDVAFPIQNLFFLVLNDFFPYGFLFHFFALHSIALCSL